MVVIIDVKEYFVKVNFDLNKDRTKNKSIPTFKGYAFKKSDTGFREFAVSFPFWTI